MASPAFATRAFMVVLSGLAYIVDPSRRFSLQVPTPSNDPIPGSGRDRGRRCHSRGMAVSRLYRRNRSAAQCVGSNAIGIMLTGMGKDGATAMLEMKRAGAFNVAQDESTCVVFGMPKEAIAAGGVDEVLPLGDIPKRVLGALRAIGGVRHRI